MLYCPICNNPVEDNATFCPNCGTQFAVSQEYVPEQTYNQQYDAQAAYNQQPEYQQPAYQQPPYQAPATPPQKKGGAKFGIIIGAAVAVIVGIIAAVFFLMPSYSKGLEFTSTGNGTCAWSGIGSCTDSKIVVPKTNEAGETVTSVASETIDFTNDNVTEVVLPETIKTIDERAFDRVENLIKVKLNEGLEIIGEDAFTGCENLESVEFPSTLKSIGENAFSYCYKITEVILPEGLTELGKFAFNECYSVKKISIPSTLNEIQMFAHPDGDIGQFDSTSIEEVNFAGNWKYSDLSFDIDEESSDVKFYYRSKLSQDISKEEYPGTFFELTEENKNAVICATFNKKSLKFNGEEISFPTEAPKGKYKVNGFYGFVVQEFTSDGKLNVSYEGVSDDNCYKDVTSNTFTYDADKNLYTYEASGECMGSSITIEKIFANFGDFIYSIDYTNIDGDEDAHLWSWTPYSGIIQDFVEEDVEIEEDELEDLVEKKEDLLADLIAAFEEEGISVSVNEETGELSLDSSVLFGGDSAALTDQGKEFLDRFVRVYTSVIYSEKYDGFISKTIVEGHTAPVAGSTYDSGLPLSEQRAGNVKDYCSSADSKLASSLEAVGLSNSKPVYDSGDGSIDMDASRRVSFRFIINIEK